jgi:hypothetical protein
MLAMKVFINDPSLYWLLKLNIMCWPLQFYSFVMSTFVHIVVNQFNMCLQSDKCEVENVYFNYLSN